MRLSLMIDSVEQQTARPDVQVLVFPGPRGIPAAAIADAPPAFIAAGTLDPSGAAPSVAVSETRKGARSPGRPFRTRPEV